MKLFLHILVLTVCSVWAASEVCDDVNTAACSMLLASDPNMCQDAAMSASCQRFCGFCPLKCYQCEEAVDSVADCSNVTTCAMDEICILRQHANADGTAEYIMGCEKKMTCEGLNLGFHAVGRRGTDERLRRDLNFHCCNVDLCNIPAEFTTTSTPPTTTTMTTLPTSTLKPLHRCARDIVFILDGSTSIGNVNHRYLKNFVQAVIGTLKIGAMDSLVAMVEYSDEARVEWYLNDHMTSSDLQNAALNIPYVTGSTATHAAFWLTRNSVLTPRHGARPNAHDVIIFITDGGTDLPGMAINEARQLHDLGVEIIAIGVGNAPDDHELDQIKSSYSFSAGTYSALKYELSEVTSKLCQ